MKLIVLFIDCLVEGTQCFSRAFPFSRTEEVE
jgi:hypothetical protein